MTEPENDAASPDSSTVTRQSFLARTAAAAAALGLGGLAATTGTAAAAEPEAKAKQPRSMAGMNVVLFITDQERAIQHFPIGWAQENLPGYTELQRNGITFNNAFTNACMCSPARSTLMTGFFPAQHGVKYTLEENMPVAQYPDQVPLSTSLANIATVMSAAGYTVVYKGKWHCSKPAGSTWTPADLGAFGFQRWNPDDAGANQSIPEMGGGSAQNDARYMGAQTTNFQDGNEGILQYINSEAAKQAPFFLICSLVNPHDVLAYPKNYEKAGYSDIWLEGDIGVPATNMEDLSTKPRAQQVFLKLGALMGPLDTIRKKRNYLNFYGNLMKWSDEYLVNVMSALKEQGLYDNTVIIRTSDHGEMGLSHGGMRQKNFNFYEETIRVPLIWSNPTLYKKAYATDAMVSHVDFLPTIASLFNAPSSARAPWQGRDYSSIVLSPKAKPVQDQIVFTYDDWQAGQANGPYVPPPQHIVSIRGQRWKLAEYYDASGVVPSEYEMYDLLNDPLETVNIAHRSYKRTPEQNRQYARMLKKLQTAKSTRLQPLA
jgi:arylsulfatase A-like enzyme